MLYRVTKKGPYKDFFFYRPKGYRSEFPLPLGKIEGFIFAENYRKNLNRIMYYQFDEADLHLLPMSAIEKFNTYYLKEFLANVIQDSSFLDWAIENEYGTLNIVKETMSNDHLTPMEKYEYLMRSLEKWKKMYEVSKTLPYYELNKVKQNNIQYVQNYLLPEVECEIFDEMGDDSDDEEEGEFG